MELSSLVSMASSMFCVVKSHLYTKAQVEIRIRRAHRAPSQYEPTTSTTIKFVPKIKLSTDMKMGLYATFYFVRGGVSFISSSFAEETELLADKYMFNVDIYTLSALSPQSTVRSHFMYTIDIENRSPVHKIDEALLFHFVFSFFFLFHSSLFVPSPHIRTPIQISATVFHCRGIVWRSCIHFG